MWKQSQVKSSKCTWRKWWRRYLIFPCRKKMLTKYGERKECDEKRCTATRDKKKSRQPASQRCSVLVAFHIRHGRDDRVLNSQMAQPEWELNSTCIWTVSMGSWISRVKLNPIQCSYSLLTPWLLPSIQAFRLVCLFVVVLLLHSSIVSSWNF